jgi:hypothetical protein
MVALSRYYLCYSSILFKSLDGMVQNNLGHDKNLIN